MGERDLGHLGQVMVQQLGQVLRFQLLGGLGEAGDVGEEDRQLATVARHLHLLLAGEDRFIDLRREVLGNLV